MKKLLTLSLLFVFGLTASFAQDITKEAKTAKKLINAYALSKDADKLEKAKAAVMMLFKNDGANANYDALLAKAALNSALAGQDTEGRIQASLGGEYTTQNAGSSLEAVRAYIMALEVAEKSSQKKAVLTKLVEVHNLAGQEFSEEYNAEAFKASFDASVAVLESYEVLKANGKSGNVIADDKVLQEYKLYSAAAAYYAEDYPAATVLMEDLAKNGSTDETVYSILFDIYSKGGDDEKAMSALVKGREYYPDSKKLLFAQIDYLIKKKDTEKLQVLLQEAVEMDPENPVIYQALGAVFGDLFKETIDAGTDGEEHFQKSKGYAEKAFELDNTFYDSQILLAELHYNKAVVIGQEINALPYDSSKEGERKYNDLLAKRNSMFETAIPYCKIAEKLDPNRKVALIFMQEILAATGDLETSIKIKERVAQLEAGEKFETSFFN